MTREEKLEKALTLIRNKTTAWKRLPGKISPTQKLAQHIQQIANDALTLGVNESEEAETNATDTES